MSKRVSFTSLLDPTAQEEPAAAPSGPPTRAPLADIAANPDNPRDPDDLDLDELIASFREVGQLQPVVVVSRAVYLTHAPGNAPAVGEAAWVVLGGNRRLEAARALGWTHLDIVVRDQLGDGEETFLDEAVIIENIHRKALAPLREAVFLQQMVERYGSQGKVAKRIGKTQAYVSQRLSLLRLDPELKEEVDGGRLGVKEARKLASLPVGEQRRAWQETQEKAAVPPETHNPVMGSSAGEAPVRVPSAPPTHNPVMGSPSPAPADPVPPVASREPSSGPGRSDPAPREPLPAMVTAEAVPWGDPRAVARMARRWMSEDGRRELAKFLTDDLD